jgi:hypothetical protein
MRAEIDTVALEPFDDRLAHVCGCGDHFLIGGSSDRRWQRGRTAKVNDVTERIESVIRIRLCWPHHPTSLEPQTFRVAVLTTIIRLSSGT